MSKNVSPEVESAKRNVKIIGAISIVLIIVLFLLLFVGILTFLTWIIAVFAVWLGANFAIRRIKSRLQQL
jgi:hypothetical protein